MTRCSDTDCPNLDQITSFCISTTKLVCKKCNWSGKECETIMRQDRKPGLNPYEAAIALGNKGFTEPKLACPKCKEYLDD